MAEVLGIIAAVTGVADVGYKLSLSLYRYSHAVASPGKAIESISSEVSLLSSVLKQLGSCLEEDVYVKLCRTETLTTTKEIAEECKTAFEELDDIIGKYVESGRIRLKDRLKWPFVEKRVTLLRVNLDRLKSTLMLMLEVLKYARRIVKNKQPPSSVDREIIVTLQQANADATQRYEKLLLAIEYGSANDDDPPKVTATTSIPKTPETSPGEDGSPPAYTIVDFTGTKLASTEKGDLLKKLENVSRLIDQIDEAQIDIMNLARSDGIWEVFINSNDQAQNRFRHTKISKHNELPAWNPATDPDPNLRQATSSMEDLQLTATAETEDTRMVDDLLFEYTTIGNESPILDDLNHSDDSDVAWSRSSSSRPQVGQGSPSPSPTRVETANTSHRWHSYYGQSRAASGREEKANASGGPYFPESLKFPPPPSGNDPKLGMDQHGTEPIYSYDGYDPSPPEVGAAMSEYGARRQRRRNPSYDSDGRDGSPGRVRDTVAASAAASAAALGTREYQKRKQRKEAGKSERERRHKASEDRDRSRSRVRDIAAASAAAGAAALDIREYQKRKERKEADRERERRRYEDDLEPPPEDYYTHDYRDDYSPSPTHASGGSYYPPTDTSQQVPGYRTWKNWEEEHRALSDEEKDKEGYLGTDIEDSSQDPERSGRAGVKSKAGNFPPLRSDAVGDEQEVRRVSV